MNSNEMTEAEEIFERHIGLNTELGYVPYKKEDIIDAINEALTIQRVVGQSEQLADHKCKPMVSADWSYLRCECGKRFKPKG